MANIKDSAMDYNPPQTKNIAELDKVPVNLEMEDREGLDNDGKTFKYKVVVLSGEDYRIPNIVLGNLKVLLQENPKMTHFKVKREGEGLKTRYFVFPVDN